jgi:DNA-binding GntR family transcriptional regulator
VAGRASDPIVERLRKMIIVGELAPGELVSEAHLCEILRCGRTPLREALQHLSHRYLLTIPPRRGVLIPPLSIVDFKKAHEAMVVMYSAWAELAAQRIHDQQVAQMRDIVTQQERANTGRQAYELAVLDARFHVVIAEATGNGYFVDFASRLHAAVSRFVYRSFETTGSARLSIAEHKEIVEALDQREPGLARLKVEEHSINSSERALSILGGLDPAIRDAHKEG